MTNTAKASLKVIFALTVLHFLGDFYGAFINPLLPVFVSDFGLSLTQVGIIAGVARLLAFVVQPAVGYLADRHRTRAFVLGGPFIAICFIPLVGLAPHFLPLLIITAMGSIGLSIFHPPTAGMISDHAGSRPSFSLALFNLGGTIAYGLGPLFITWYVSRFGLNKTALIMLPGLFTLVLIMRFIPRPRGEGLKDFGFIGSIRASMGKAWKLILLGFVVMVLRTFAGQSFIIFVPVMYVHEGFSLVGVGGLVSVFTLTGALSGLIGGYLADRVGYRPVYLVSFLLVTPCFLALLYLPGHWVYLASMLSGFTIMATLPLGVAMAQELAPRGKAMAASLMMGLAYGLGGMMTSITGRLADSLGIRPVLTALAFIPILLLPLAAFLPVKVAREPQPRGGGGCC